MATYFNPSDEDDKRLLPVSVRDNPEVADLAPVIEDEVITFYTEVLDYPITPDRLRYRDATQIGGTSSVRWVFLRGYTEDSDDADVDAAFKTAFKRTIARVIAWRIAQGKGDPLLVSESSADGAKAKTRRRTAWEPLPEGWNDLLAPYDTREPAWMI